MQGEESGVYIHVSVGNQNSNIGCHKKGSVVGVVSMVGDEYLQQTVTDTHAGGRVCLILCVPTSSTKQKIQGGGDKKGQLPREKKKNRSRRLELSAISEGCLDGLKNKMEKKKKKQGSTIHPHSPIWF